MEEVHLRRPENLIQVTEPDPANPTFITYYTYNPANQLTQTSMTRGTVTQTRTFQWTGADLTSATNPENGTVTYTYDGAHHVTQRTDAKNQRTTYAYDSYGRLIQVRHYDSSNTLQPNQNVDYSYDWYSDSHNAWGRLAKVSFGNAADHPPAYVYWYNTAGRVTKHQFVISDGDPNTQLIEATYQWDNRGRMTQMSVPSAVELVNYQYDEMGRLVGC